MVCREFVNGASNSESFKLRVLIIVTTEPSTRLYLRQPRLDIGVATLKAMISIDEHEIKRCIQHTLGSHGGTLPNNLGAVTSKGHPLACLSHEFVLCVLGQSSVPVAAIALVGTPSAFPAIDHRKIQIRIGFQQFA